MSHVLFFIGCPQEIPDIGEEERGPVITPAVQSYSPHREEMVNHEVPLHDTVSTVLVHIELVPYFCSEAMTNKSINIARLKTYMSEQHCETSQLVQVLS